VSGGVNDIERLEVLREGGRERGRGEQGMEKEQ